MSLFRTAALAAILAAASPPAAASSPPAGDLAPALLVNELDADQTGVDGHEFVELYCPDGAADLSGVFLVLYNGSADGDPAYDAIDLLGAATDEDGLLVVGSPLVPGVDIAAFTTNGLQNGPDGVALWWAPAAQAADFLGRGPAGAPPGARLLDAVVHGSGQADATLQAALAPGQTALDESGSGPAAVHSLQRLPDGGAPFDAAAFVAAPPTPGELNGAPLSLAIHEVQGAGHLSPYGGGWVVDLVGVVTARLQDGFVLQQPDGTDDGDPATSEALFVRTGVADGPAVGDLLAVSGRIDEHKPGGVAANLSTTRLIVAPENVLLLARGQPLPRPVVLGAGGRPPPSEVIDDDTTGGDVELGRSLFDPDHDALDFFESLEGMRVRIDEALVVGPTSTFGEIAVVGDAGRLATGLSGRGVLARTPEDSQPERILVDDLLVKTPVVDVGDRFAGPLTGVLGYSFGSFKVLLTEPVRALPRGLPPQQAPPASPDGLTVATLNVENLSAASPPRKLAGLARTVVEHLRSPDLLALQEVQDDSGPFDDGVTTARQTLAALAAAIAAAGGPRYEAAEIAPLDGKDGGQPGGNIRLAYLWRPDRGLSLVEHPGGDATTAVAVTAGPGGVHLRPSPGRIRPDHWAWAGSRKPLAAQFAWDGRAFFVVNVHFASKGGDSPLFGALQPPAQSSQPRRVVQAGLVRAFADEVLAADPHAFVLVLGDLNDFQDSPTLAELTGEGALVNLLELLPEPERYTYLFEGVGNALDHVLASPALLAAAEVGFRVVHVHAEYAEAASDHDPVVLSLRFPDGASAGAASGLRAPER